MAAIDVGKRIKSVRKRKGLTLQDLAGKSGMSATAISAIERNVSSPTVNTLGSIARALGESLSSLLGEADVEFQVTRAGGRERPATEIRGMDLQSLASGIPGQRFLPMIGVLNPGAACGEDFITPQGDGLLFVLKGALDVELDGKSIHLDEGDSLYYRSQTPYRWKNASESETHLLVVSAR